MNYLFSLFRVKSLKLFVIFSVCNLWITSGLAEEACGVVTTACPTLNIPYSPQEGVVGTIGNGFDSDRDRYKPMRCLNGTETSVGGGTSTLSATVISSYEELLQRLEIAVGAKVKYGIFSAESSAKFVNELLQKSFSQSFTFAYDVKLNNASFSIDPSNPLNDTGRAAATNSCRFREICGDQFVYQIERGASLYVNLQFQFSSEYHKQQFDVSAKAGIETTVGGCGKIPFSGSIEASVKYLTESTRKDGVMRITALQIGGSVEQLARILGSTGDIPSMSCSLDNLTACTQALDKIAGYAASTDFSTGVRQYPTNLKYHYGNYWEVSPTAPRLNVDVTPEIETARADLAIAYANRLSDVDKIAALLKTYTLSSDHKQQLTTLQTALAVDITQLQDAANVCFGDLANCLAKKCQVFNSLTKYSIDDLLKINFNEGMVAYYPVDTNMKDATGNGNDARLAIGSVSSTQGKMGGAYKFDGSTHLLAGPYPNVPNSANLNIQNSITFATWLKSSNTSDYSAALHRYNGGGFLLVANRSNTNKASCQLLLSHPYTGAYVDSTTPVIDSLWHHIACTYDGSNLRIYVDGKEQGISPYSYGTSYIPNEPLYIGRDPYGSRYFTGELDDIRIYNRSLSAEEVQTLYQLPNPSQPAKLTVAKQGEGTISAQGIDCGADCTEDYPLNQIVSLTATPATDYTFTNWQGCAIVTSNVCQVTVDAAKTVTATFTQKPVAPPPVVNHTLTVSKQGEGSITGTGINCGTDCTESLAANTQITLTATPAANFTFTDWDGCTSSNNVCQITLDAAKTVTAKFTATVTPPPVDPPPPVVLTPECVPFHAIYTAQDKLLKIPFMEIPMVAIIGGTPTNRIESYSAVFRLLNGSEHFQLKEVNPPTLAKNGCAVANYNPETGMLYLPYVDIPIVTKIGNKQVETQRAIYEATLHWVPMLGNNVFVVEKVKQLQ